MVLAALGVQPYWITTLRCARARPARGRHTHSRNCPKRHLALTVDRWHGTFHQELAALDFTQPPWSTHYPAIPALFEHGSANYTGCKPANNVVIDNSCHGDPKTPGRFLVTSPDLGHPIEVADDWGDQFSRNTNESGCVLYA